MAHFCFCFCFSSYRYRIDGCFPTHLESVHACIPSRKRFLELSLSSIQVCPWVPRVLGCMEFALPRTGSSSVMYMLLCTGSVRICTEHTHNEEVGGFSGQREKEMGSLPSAMAIPVHASRRVAFLDWLQMGAMPSVASLPTRDFFFSLFFFFRMSLA